MIDQQRDEEKEAMYWLTRAGELGVLTVDLKTQPLSDIEYIRRTALIALDNEAKD